MLYLLYIPILLLILLLYFRFADRFNIVDKPNHRSSHVLTTVRGGGILFPLALFIHFGIGGGEYPVFTAGLLLISMVSFYDDLRPLSNVLRLLVHLIAVSLLIAELDLASQTLWMLALFLVLIIGTINAYNFMDGINGITASYSLLTLLSLLYLNESLQTFISFGWLVVSTLAVFVFSLFNFRSRAKCFAGDVGSISIAFIIVFFILQLVVLTGDVKYIGLLLFYGLDTVTTLIIRIIRRENIFQAHRSHFYQHLANARGWTHLKVSILYMLLQLIVNVLIINSEMDWLAFLLFVLFSGIVFILIRFTVEGKKYLLSGKLRAQIQGD